MAMRLGRLRGARPLAGTEPQDTSIDRSRPSGERLVELARDHAALGAVLALAAFMNLWNLTANGYGNSYYAAAVRSMTQSWHNFFFASFDPAGFITVDKPPVGLWLQAASAKLLGFSGFSILLPEALAGVGAVFVLYLAVSRVFGRTAGLAAGLALALTPISVAINRSNNLDSTLAFFTVVAAYAIVRAVEKGNLRWLLLSALMIGVAFNTKTLAGLIAAPALFGAYLVTAPISLPRRVRDLAIATALVAAISASWVAAVDLTPASSRPYVGGSQENTELDLLVNYNGLGRIDGEQGPGNGPPAGLGNGALPTLPGAQDGAAPPAGTTLPNGDPATGALPPFDGANAGGARPGGDGGPGGAGFTGGDTGPLRLFHSELSAQASWLIPLALIGGLGALVSVLWADRRLKGNQRLASIMVWGGWLLIAGAVFSQAKGIFHPYYLSYLGPAIGGMVGISVATFWQRMRSGSWLALFAPVAILATAVFEVSVLRLTPDYKPWLVPALVAGVAGGTILLFIALFRRGAIRYAGAGLVLAIAALMLPPLVWSGSLLGQAGNAALPYVAPASASDGFAAPGGGGPGGVPRTNQGLISYLEANRGDAKYLVATESSMNASGIIIATGEPVMAVGGFNGADPALTVEQFARLVEDGTVRYFLVGGAGGPPGIGDGTDARPADTDTGPAVRPDGPAARPNDDGPRPPGALDGARGAIRSGNTGISQAVAAAGKLVDATAYGGTAGSGGGQLYDLQGTAAAIRAAGGQ